MSKTDIQKNRNKTVVISGSTSGLGKEMSIEFAKRGWVVAGFGKTKSKVDEMTKIMGVKHQIKECDVSCNKSVKSFSENIIKKLGVPNLLINNAAVMNTPKPLWEVPKEEFDYLTQVNINGVANMVRHFLPSMLEKREGLSGALAQELPQGMGCIALNPGVIDTDMLRKCWGNGAELYQKPGEWAKLAVPFIESLTHQDNGKQMSAP